MKPTRDSSAGYVFAPNACEEFHGSIGAYQNAAASAMADYGHTMFPWDWVTAGCGTVNCVNPTHLTVRHNVTLEYAPGQCIYCGQPSGTRDHLLPRAWTGETQRRFVVTVPACGECNTLLGSTLTWSITERRAIAHARLRRKKAAVLRTLDFTPEELQEFGHTLRSTIVRGMAEKRRVLARLSFPSDPSYDQRAIEKAGIENGWAIGLLLPDGAGLEAAVRAAMRDGRAA